MMRRPYGFLFLVAVTLFSRGASAGPTLQFSLRLKDEVSILATNKALAKRGIPERLPESVVLDLSLPGRVLHESYWTLWEIADKAGSELDPEASIRGACFVGSNEDVSKRIGYLSDGWLSEQFTLIRANTRSPDAIEILFSQGDDGTDRNWLRIGRCL